MYPFHMFNCIGLDLLLIYISAVVENSKLGDNISPLAALPPIKVQVTLDFDTALQGCGRFVSKYITVGQLPFLTSLPSRDE